MKKLLCLLLCFSFIFSLCACSDSKPANTDNVNSKVASPDTVDLVNDAIKKTADAIRTAKGLGYKCDFRRTLKLGESQDAASLTVDMVILKSDAGDTLAFETETKATGHTDSATVYNAGGKTYGFKAGACYLLADDDSLKAYVKQLYDTPTNTVFEAEKLTAVDTTVVNTSTGGHGFVVEYDCKDEDFKPSEIFSALYVEGSMEGIVITPVSLRLSGIVNADGKIISHTVRYIYEYEVKVEQEVDDSQVDVESDTITVTKKATVELEAELSFDYSVTEVKVPEGITVPVKDAEGNETPKLKELSLADFGKLSAGGSTEEKK